MKFLILLIIFFAPLTQNTVTNSETLQRFVGQWEGTLTYLDYQTGEPYTLDVNMVINQKNDRQLSVEYVYPNEPKANNKSNFNLSKDGKSWNKQAIVSHIKGDIGEDIIITEQLGKDDNKKATIKMVYIISDTSMKIIKEIQFENSDDWIKRNEFSLKK